MCLLVLCAFVCDDDDKADYLVDYFPSQSPPEQDEMLAPSLDFDEPEHLLELLDRALAYQRSPVPLTPIQEVTEPSGSSLSYRRTSGIDSDDLSSVDSQSLRARKFLRQLQRPPVSGGTSPESRRRDVDPADLIDRMDRLWSSVEAPEGRMQPSSSRSSLSNFLRLESGLESGVQLNDEDLNLAAGQHDISLYDLVSDLRAVQQQHLDNAPVTLATAEKSSSGSTGGDSASTANTERLIGLLHELARVEDGGAGGSGMSPAAVMLQQLQLLRSSTSNPSSSPRGSTAATGSTPSEPSDTGPPKQDN